MAQYLTSVATPRRPEDAFEFMASFENVAGWDPSVAEAERIDPGELGVGSRFRVVVSSAGRRQTLLYRITEFEPPRRVLLIAETSTLRSADEITVEATPGGAKVTYDAGLHLVGPLRVFNPVLGLVSNQIGDRAAAGLLTEMQK